MYLLWKEVPEQGLTSAISSSLALWSTSTALWSNDLKRQQQPPHLCSPCGWHGCYRHSTKHPFPWSSHSLNTEKTGSAKDEILVTPEFNQLMLLISVRLRFHSHLWSVFLHKKVFYTWWITAKDCLYTAHKATEQLAYNQKYTSPGVDNQQGIFSAIKTHHVANTRAEK